MAPRYALYYSDSRDKVPGDKRIAGYYSFNLMY
jgi:hypothetical protein